MMTLKNLKFIGFAFLGTAVLFSPAVTSSARRAGENQSIRKIIASIQSEPKFSSVYTDTTKDCKGAEPSFTCKGYGDYRFVMGIGGVFQNARIESTKSDYALDVADRQSIGWNPKVEWRMANGKPFAVILRVEENDENADTPKKIGEWLVVKGLQGFDAIDERVDAKTANANEKARDIADRGFTDGAQATQTSAPNDAYTDGKAALLTDEQIADLKKLNAAVGVPTYVPAGFRLKTLEIEKPEQHIIAFSATYADASGKYFKIGSNNEALGDMAVKREIKISNAYFLDSAQETAEFFAGRDESDADTIASEWLCSTAKYQPKTTKIAQCFQLTSNAKSLSSNEAMKIMQSLRYLKR